MTDAHIYHHEHNDISFRFLKHAWSVVSNCWWLTDQSWIGSTKPSAGFHHNLPWAAKLALQVIFSSKLHKTKFTPQLVLMLRHLRRHAAPTHYNRWHFKQKINNKKTQVLTGRISKSSPISKYRLNFLSAPSAIYSCVSATLHGCQQPKMRRLFLRAILPVCPPPHPALSAPNLQPTGAHFRRAVLLHGPN